MNNANDNLAPGDVVSGLEPTELVEIQRVVPFGNKTLVEGVGLQSRRVVNVHSRFSELHQSSLSGGERPRLRIIHDPISRLTPEMLCRKIHPFAEDTDWPRQGNFTGEVS